MLVLKLNGLPVPFSAMGQPTQTYEQAGGFTDVTMQDGSTVRQRRWRKLTTQITGAGVVPPALAGIDWDVPVEVDCVGQRGVMSPVSSVVLPVGRRSDVAPFGFGVMPSGMVVPTDGVLSGDVFVMTPVAGAAAYKAVYFPRLTIWSAGPSESFDLAGMVASWSISGREA